jgi:hypothetical protein
MKEQNIQTLLPPNQNVELRITHLEGELAK